MCDVNKLFYTPEGNEYPIEGYLDKENPRSDVLFVLREPHATEEDTKEFWLYNIVNDHQRTDGKRYVNVLGRLAAKLLKEPIGSLSEEEQLNCYKELLKRCAFINLYPFCGKKTKSENYSKTLGELYNAEPKAVSLTQNDKGEYSKIVANRLEIIYGLKPHYIVTVCDIFDAFKDKHGAAQPNGLLYKDKHFEAIDMENGTKVLAFYHPSYTRIAYDYLKATKLGWEETRS